MRIDTGKNYRYDHPSTNGKENEMDEDEKLKQALLDYSSDEIIVEKSDGESKATPTPTPKPKKVVAEVKKKKNPLEEQKKKDNE